MTENKKKLVYIIAPYRSIKNQYGYPKTFKIKNIMTATQELAWVLENTYNIIPVCPHVMFPNMDEFKSDEYFLDATLEIMKKCDAVYVLDQKITNGMINEIETADELSLEILECRRDVVYYDNEQNKKNA